MATLRTGVAVVLDRKGQSTQATCDHFASSLLVLLYDGPPAEGLSAIAGVRRSAAAPPPAAATAYCTVQYGYSSQYTDIYVSDK